MFDWFTIKVYFAMTDEDYIGDDDAVDAFFTLSRMEGIIPAIESSHAVAYGIKLAKERDHGSVLICLSGRGDKDMDFVLKEYGEKYGIK